MYKGVLLALFLSFSILGYSQTINGYITDDQNNSLPAVNISILNQSNGISSDKNGKYSLEVPANRSVVITYSFIGFQTEKIRIPMVGKKRSLNLSTSVAIILSESLRQIKL